MQEEKNVEYESEFNDLYIYMSTSFYSVAVFFSTRNDQYPKINSDMVIELKFSRRN